MLDVVILIILLLFAIAGSKRGIISTVMAFLSTLGALILAFIVYPVVNMILKLTPIYVRIHDKVAEKISGIDFGTTIQAQNNVIKNSLDWLPNFVGEVLIQNNSETAYQTLGVQNIIDYISLSVTNIIVALIALLITWIVLKCILVGGITRFGKMVANLPVISSIDHIGGFALGIIKGLITLWIISLILPLVMTSIGSIDTYIEGTTLCKWLYENNFVLMIFENIFG